MAADNLNFGIEKYSDRSLMTARLAFPSCGGALTATWYSLALICVTLSFFACGLTDTEIVRGIALGF
jgi:hypothetical protein